MLHRGTRSLIFCYYYSLLASLLKIGIAMVLYQYFKKESNSMLPDEKGKLSKIVPSSYISAANKKVSQLTTRASDLGKMTRGPYLKISAEKKADIGKYAAEHGIVAAVRHFSKDSQFSGSRTLKETTVHDWKVKYLCELPEQKRKGDDLVVKALPIAEIELPLMLSDDLDKKVQNYMFGLRDVVEVLTLQ